jgi:hypothetical protein
MTFTINVVEIDPRFSTVHRDEPGTFYVAKIGKQVGDGPLMRLDLKTACFDPDDTQERRFALDTLYETLKHSLREAQFPEHSLIYDPVKTKDGRTLYANPRYPDL